VSETWPSFLATFGLLGAGAIGTWAWSRLLEQIKTLRDNDQLPHRAAARHD